MLSQATGDGLDAGPAGPSYPALQSLGMIRIKQRAKEYAREGVDLAQTDFVRLTESFGGVGWKVDTLEEFDIAFGEALGSDKLHVIDVRVDADLYA